MALTASPALETHTRSSRAGTEFVVQGELDLGSIPSLEAQLLAALEERPARLVVDLTAVGFIDSSGVHLLERIRRQAVEGDVAFVALAPRGSARKVFELTGREGILSPAAPLRVVADHHGSMPCVALLDADPDLAAHIEVEQRARARAIVSTQVLDLPAGPWERTGLVDYGERTFGAVVLSGLITRHLDVGGHPGLEFYGPTDVVGAWELEVATLPAEEAWTATVPSRLALLDDRFLAAVRRWPRLLTGLFQRTRLQHDRLALQLVIAEQPRVDERLLSLFWHLSERFGHVTPDGIVLSLALTHEALGRLIGARRPTVTLALKALADRDAVVRMADRSWLVRERPRSLITTEAGLSSRAQPVPLARPL